MHWHHDLYGGINYTGVFDSEKKAKEFANKQTGYDEIHILFLPYIQFEGKIYALWEEKIKNYFQKSSFGALHPLADNGKAFCELWRMQLESFHHVLQMQCYL